MFWNQDQLNNFINAVNVLSFFLAVQNLGENRLQSEQNDVQAANEKQTDKLLDELKSEFNHQNLMISDIIKRLDKLEVPEV